MILAVVTEEVDELGRRRYVAVLAELVDEDEEKPYGRMGLEPSWRRWTHKEIAILVANGQTWTKRLRFWGEQRRPVD